MGRLPTGTLSLIQVRDHVLKSGSFNIRDRRAIWLAFQKDSATFTGNISMSDFKGKDYDQSWVWYGSETLHNTKNNTNNGNYEFKENQVLTSPYVEGDWQYRWTVNRITKSSWNQQVSGHGRNRHGRYSRSPRYEMRYNFSAYKKRQRRAW